MRVMGRTTHKLVEPVAEFERGDVVVRTAEYGSWHPYDVKLEPVQDAATGSIEVTREKLEYIT